MKVVPETATVGISLLSDVKVVPESAVGASPTDVKIVPETTVETSSYSIAESFSRVPKPVEPELEMTFGSASKPSELRPPRSPLKFGAPKTVENVFDDSDDDIFQFEDEDIPENRPVSAKKRKRSQENETAHQAKRINTEKSNAVFLGKSR